MYATRLDWCAEDNLNVPVVDKDGLADGTMLTRELDVIIGTDVVYWPQMIKPLVNTLTKLFTI